MTITPPYPPETELVALALFGTFAGLRTDRLATKLPKLDRTDWSDEGFLTINSLATGRSAIDLPKRAGVVQVDAYASAGQMKGTLAPWAKAARLVGIIRGSLESESFPYGQTVDLPNDYAPARVLSAFMLTEPERVQDDPSAFAHYTFDVEIHWTTVS